MPTVTILSAAVISAARSDGMHSSVTANAPASSTAFASASTFSAASRVLPCFLKPPYSLTDCGVIPTCARTGMPAVVRRRMSPHTDAPPSSFTASAPALMIATAFFTASSSPHWYEPNGMSPTTIASFAPRATAATAASVSDMLTGSVVSYPRQLFPCESPTRMIGAPASSASRAKHASYAVTQPSLVFPFAALTAATFHFFISPYPPCPYSRLHLARRVS